METGLARFWNITSSHVYRELRTLEERGYVKAGAPGVRERIPFSITSAGRRAFRQWLARPPGAEQMRFPLLVTLWFGRHLDPSTLAEFVATSRADHGARLELYEAVVGGLSDDDDPGRTAVIRFGIAYERAVLEWLDGL